jgi:hypothetical protein
MPSAFIRFANSSTPVLSNTLINPRSTAICFLPNEGHQCKRRAPAKAKRHHSVNRDLRAFVNFYRC